MARSLNAYRNSPTGASLVRALFALTAVKTSVSEEVFRAAETGSGYSGRRIPETAFRGILTDIVQWMVTDFDDQILRPLIRRNFGQEPEYEIIVFGLVEQEDEVRALTSGDGQIVPNQSAQKAKAATAV